MKKVQNIGYRYQNIKDLYKKIIYSLRIIEKNTFRTQFFAVKIATNSI
jgi:hypothetical protein